MLPVIAAGLLFPFSAVASPSPDTSLEKVIYSFAGDEDGEYPDTELVADSAGNLYGTTVSGGEHDSGTVFRLSPAPGGWTHTILYSFSGGADGAEPYKGVTLDANGNLYGTAVIGGLHTGPCIEDGCGVAYKLSPSGSRWTQTVIHFFTGGADGYGPGTRPTFDRKGNLFGTTPVGGSTGFGIVYELKPAAAGAPWAEQIVHTFTGTYDGIGGSAGRLVFDQSGNIYGTCTAGGEHGAGTVYKLAPSGNGGWTETTLYAFRGAPDAGFPYGAVTFDSQGNLYGTTYYAGANNLGSIYRLTERNGTWTETALYSFTGGPDGLGPISTLARGSDGNLYGTASEAGAPGCSCGVVFKVGVSGQSFKYAAVYRFKTPPDAGFPYDGLTADATGTTFYGATVHGGASNEGAVFSFTP